LADFRTDEGRSRARREKERMKREKGRPLRKRWKESSKEEYVQRELRVGRQMRKEGAGGSGMEL